MTDIKWSPSPKQREYDLAREWLESQYDEIIATSPTFANDVSKTQYCRANINAVLTFDRRMQLLRAGRGDIKNAWTAEAVEVIGF